MTLWGDCERIHIENPTSWAVASRLPLSECDWDFRPQNMTQKVQTHAQRKNYEFSQAVQQVYMVYCTLAAHHVLCRTPAQHDVAYTEIAWTDGALLPSFSTFASPHRWVTSTQELWGWQKYKKRRHRGTLFMVHVFNSTRLWISFVNQFCESVFELTHVTNTQ